MAEAGHQPGRPYFSQATGSLHLNGANLHDQGDNAVPQIVTFAYSSPGSNECAVSVQVEDGQGNALASVYELLFYLSDSAAGAGLTATTASGGIAVTTGTQLQAKVAAKALDTLTNASGVLVVTITDTANTDFYPCVVCPGTGRLFVGPQLQSSNY